MKTIEELERQKGKENIIETKRKVQYSALSTIDKEENTTHEK
jgi:hypothetical protein